MKSLAETVRGGTALQWAARYLHVTAAATASSLPAPVQQINNARILAQDSTDCRLQMLGAVGRQLSCANIPSAPVYKREGSIDT
jgi:hypothetical protein